MICKNCNQIIEDSSKFCPNCGTPQEEGTANKEPLPMEGNTDHQAPPEPEPQIRHQAPPEPEPQFSPQAPPYPEAAPTPQPSYYYQQEGPGHDYQHGNAYLGQEINTTPYLVFAIITTICCCIPLGIPAIVFASKISSAQHAGDMEEARECAKKAKIFTIIAAAVGAVFWIIYMILVMIGGILPYYYY